MRAPIRRGLKLGSAGAKTIKKVRNNESPDQKGTETRNQGGGPFRCGVGNNESPDQKGTETIEQFGYALTNIGETMRAPIRRGLKPGDLQCVTVYDPETMRAPIRRGLKLEGIEVPTTR